MAALTEAPPITLPTELSQLSGLIDEKVDTLAVGDEEIQKSALSAAKYLFDLGADMRKNGVFMLLTHKLL